MATDYKSWKVVDLKAELKRRDVPQTGLRLKQQLVDRLVELDNNPSTTDHDNDDRNGNDDTAANTNTSDASDTTEQEQSPQKPPHETEKQNITPEETAVVDQDQTQQENPAQDNELPRPAEANTVQETSIDASKEQIPDQPGAPEVSQPELEESGVADGNAQQNTTPPHDSASDSLPEQTIEESRKRRRSESVSSTQAITKKAKQSIETTSETLPDVAAPVGQQPEPASKSPEDADLQDSGPVRPAGPITKQASPAPAAPVAAAAAVAAVETDRVHAETQE
ncbi:Apoptotic chromatin condensation inducer in the nucleus, partial [Ascosphaera pollenicola]